jgi:tetratricopeptide (TPR) repeat protein
MHRVILLVLLFAVSAAAQRTPANKSGPGNGDLPGSNTSAMLMQKSLVQVRVIAENEQPIEEHTRVQLLRSDGIVPVAETLSSDGMAQFPNVPPGFYILRVSGVTIEDAQTARFEVPAIAATTVQFVHVKLNSVAGPAGAGSTQGTVSAYDLNIPKKAREEFTKGAESMQRTEWKKASAHLDKAVSIYPQYAAAYNNLGVVSMRLSDTVKAKASFQKAIDLNDTNGSAYLNLGRLYLMDRNFDEAARLIGKSLTMDRSSPEALTLLSDCELATGHYTDAIVHARRVHTLPHQRFAVAHLIAASAYERQGNSKDASAEYEQFLKEDPRSPRAASARKALERMTAGNQPGDAGPKP